MGVGVYAPEKGLNVVSFKTDMKLPAIARPELLMMG